MKNNSRRENPILYRRGKGEKVLFAVMFTIFALYAFSLVYPFVWLVGNFLKTAQGYKYQQALGETFKLPESFEYSNYVKAFTEMNYNGIGFISMFANSILYTAITTCGGFFSARLRDIASPNIVFAAVASFMLWRFFPLRCP